MPRQWTVQCAYSAHWANTVTVEADTLDQALLNAIDAASQDCDGWRSTDHASDTFIDAVAEGADVDPWGTTRLPVPPEYSEFGPPPVLTILDAGTPQETLQITRGVILFRFKTPHGDITAERSDHLPSPNTRPSVTIRRRPDGAPDIEVTNGDVRVSIIDF